MDIYDIEIRFSGLPRETAMELMEKFETVTKETLPGYPVCVQTPTGKTKVINMDIFLKSIMDEDNARDTNRPSS